MKRHDAFLELAVVAIDFPLAPAERTRLDAHLSGCPACARSASLYRSDAAAIAGLPRMALPERRAASVLAAALHPSARWTPLRLAVVAALLALALLGSLWAGSQIVRLGDDEDLAVVPVPGETLDPIASPVAVESPSAVPEDGLPAPMVVTVEQQNGDGTRTPWIAILEPNGRLTPLAVGDHGAWADQWTVVYTCGDLAAATPRTGDGPEQTGTADICSVAVEDPSAASVLVRDGMRPVPSTLGDLVFHRGAIDTAATWLADADGARLLAPGDYGRWSPDGAWLVGQQADSTSYIISTVRIDGLSDALGVDTVPGYDPAWSPSGSRIVFALVEADAVSLRTFTPSTGEVAVLYTAGFDTAIGGPVWVNDAVIVFVQDGDVYRLDIGASAPVRLTGTGSVEVSGYSQGLEVSPDGQWIAYTAARDGSSAVEVVSIDGSTTVTFPDLGVSRPRWGPIGAAIPPTPEPSSDPGSPAPPAGTPEPGTGTTEGYDWSEVEVPSTPARPVHVIEAVSTGAGGFVAVGRTCTGDPVACEAVALVSPDGRSWQRAPVQASLDVGGYLPTSGPEVGMFDVVGGANGVVAVGYAYAGGMRPTAWFSPDGLTWQRVALAADDRYRVTAVTWDGQRYVAVGEDRSEWEGWDGAPGSMASAVVRAAAWTSPDGVTWTRAPASSSLVVGDLIDTTEDPMSGGMADVVEGPGGLVAVGSSCTATPRRCEPAAWRSDDGLTWQRLGGLPALAGGLSAIATQGGETPFIAVGRWDCDEPDQLPGGGCPALVLASGDLVSWTRQASFPQAGHLRTITWVGDRFLATAPDGPETVWASRDGFEWSAASMPGGPATSSVGDIAEWQFAATPGTAVWLGVPMASDRSGAWVSPPTE